MKQILLSAFIATAPASFVAAQDTLPDMPATDIDVSPDIAPEPLEAEGAKEREDRENAASDERPVEETPQ